MSGRGTYGKHIAWGGGRGIGERATRGACRLNRRHLLAAAINTTLLHGA